MCGKSHVYADEEPKDKKKRIVMSLLVTAEVLNKLDTGMRIAVVTRHYGVSKSFIGNEDRIRESNDFLDMCLKFNHKMEAVMAPFTVICKCMQKKEPSQITFSSFCLQALPVPHTRHFFNQYDNFQPGKPEQILLYF
jgi:hypothetical protein